jgi:peptidyl-tRNA hydrolase
MNVKQVIVMRTKFPHPTKNGEFIKPRRGKMIAQACHASLKIFFDRMEKVYWGERGSPNADNEYDWVSELTPEMESWTIRAGRTSDSFNKRLWPNRV